MSFTAMLRTPEPARDVQSSGAALVASVSGTDELADPNSIGLGIETAFTRHWRAETRGVATRPTTSSPPNGGTTGTLGRLPCTPAVGVHGGTSIFETMGASPPLSNAGWSALAP